MLGWMTGQNQNEQFAHSADNSKVLDPPETPAPVFALRAFKSALFGTPAPEEEEDRDRVSRAKEQQPASRAREQVDSRKDHSTGSLRNDNMPTLKPDTAPTGNTMASPTKSILVTPGTISNRRKTVSFGDGVVDNERKQDSPSKAPSLTTPTNSSTSPSSQWASGSSDGKPRSKLTQALLDSREKRSSKDFQPTQTSKPSETRSGGTTSKMAPLSAGNDDNDETLNMDEPRSQSGKYWKTEFDKYRTKTDWEIKRLVQYRSVAKAYARKKDEEAVRLAEKLKQEEEKVAEMERHVSQLASTMVTEGDKHDKEKLIQDLTKQTALALQYKHRVTMLRKALEQHGVVSNEMEDIKEQPDGNDKTSEELRKTQQALEQANAKIKSMQNQRSDLSKLHDLSESSEQKASDLEKENATLKHTLARFKSEMTKYEGRRKEKEAKLKQREAKLELRIREYRERLRTVTQRHRESQESLKESFEEERHSLLEQIERLKLTLGTLDRLPDFESGRLTLSPRKDYTGVKVYDFGQRSPQRGRDNDETEEFGDPPSPSPRSKERRYRQLRSATDDPLDLRRAAQAMGIDIDGDDNDPSIYAEEEEGSPQRQSRRFNHVPDDEGDVVIPPSSPPDLSSIKPSYNRRLSTRLDHGLDDQRTTSRGRYLADLEEEKQARAQQRRRRSPTKYGLEALSGNTKQQRLGLSESQRDAMPIDRKIAAQARLKRKEASRKAKEEAIGAF